MNRIKWNFNVIILTLLLIVLLSFNYKTLSDIIVYNITIPMLPLKWWCL